MPIFLYGSADELRSALCENLLKHFPHLQIASVNPSRFRRLSDTERDETVAEIRASGAALAFVGLDCTRLGVWVFEFRQQLSMPLLAICAAFNFHAGTLPKAPPMMQDRSLEWFY